MNTYEYEWSKQCPQCGAMIYGLQTHKGKLIAPANICDCGMILA